MKVRKMKDFNDSQQELFCVLDAAFSRLERGDAFVENANGGGLTAIGSDSYGSEKARLVILDKAKGRIARELARLWSVKEVPLGTPLEEFKHVFRENKAQEEAVYV